VHLLDVERERALALLDRLPHGDRLRGIMDLIATALEHDRYVGLPPTASPLRPIPEPLRDALAAAYGEQLREWRRRLVRQGRDRTRAERERRVEAERRRAAEEEAASKSLQETNARLLRERRAARREQGLSAAEERLTEWGIADFAWAEAEENRLPLGAAEGRVRIKVAINRNRAPVDGLGQVPLSFRREEWYPEHRAALAAQQQQLAAAAASGAGGAVGALPTPPLGRLISPGRVMAGIFGTSLYDQLDGPAARAAFARPVPQPPQQHLYHGGAAGAAAGAGAGGVGGVGVQMYHAGAGAGSAGAASAGAGVGRGHRVPYGTGAYAQQQQQHQQRGGSASAARGGAASATRGGRAPARGAAAAAGGGAGGAAAGVVWTEDAVRSRLQQAVTAANLIDAFTGDERAPGLAHAEFNTGRQERRQALVAGMYGAQKRPREQGVALRRFFGDFRTGAVRLSTALASAGLQPSQALQQHYAAAGTQDALLAQMLASPHLPGGPAPSAIASAAAAAGGAAAPAAAAPATAAALRGPGSGAASSSSLGGAPVPVGVGATAPLVPAGFAPPAGMPPGAFTAAAGGGAPALPHTPEMQQLLALQASQQAALQQQYLQLLMSSALQQQAAEAGAGAGGPAGMPALPAMPQPHFHAAPGAVVLQPYAAGPAAAGAAPEAAEMSTSAAHHVAEGTAHGEPGASGGSV
jgi:hypothetical protein